MTTYSVLIEGNIASGKTTAIKILERNLKDKVKVFEEPLQTWTNYHGANLLHQMYENPTRTAFTFQTFVQCTMAQIQFEEIKDKIKITERSLLSERFVFIEAIKSLNFIDQSQYHILIDWFNLIESKVPPVNEVIYLRTSPEIAYNRLKLRNRPEEQTVNLEYIQLLFNLYENWLIHQTFGELPFKVTIVDQDKDLESFNREMSTLTNRLEAILNG